MGMYDSIRCEYALPGDAPANAAELDFQTKDLDCLLETFTINKEGLLEGKEQFTGSISFYTSNIVASGPGIYTADGEDAQHLEYLAVFVDGKISKITEIENRKEPALKVRPFPMETRTPEEIERSKRRAAESLLGRKMCIWWGGDFRAPYRAAVVAENAKELVFQKEDGGFEIIGRFQRDNCFFDSHEDGEKHKEERAADWAKRKAEYQEELARRSAGTSAEV
jgi:hypothetical protein